MGGHEVVPLVLVPVSVCTTHLPIVVYDMPLLSGSRGRHGDCLLRIVLVGGRVGNIVIFDLSMGTACAQHGYRPVEIAGGNTPIMISKEV